MELLVIIALWLFAITNLDTFLLLVAFCADEHYGLSEIVLGHYLGFSLGLLGAIVGALVVGEMLHEWAFLLGAVPLCMGVWGLARRRGRAEPAVLEVPAPGIERVLIVTIAGLGLSGENIALFVPFFLRLSPGELLTVVVSYLFAAGLVLLLAWIVATRLVRVRIPDWIEQILVPLTLVIVGGFVLLAGWFAA